MAPSRKRAGGKAAAAAAARRQWKVGDLVLAKLKGFPAWPAVVSEPEKWGYSADWKKVLVHFFGTQQIAFCNPADVESFTEEKKQSLLTKRHAKGSDFVRAVKEITESYEKMKQQEKGNDSKAAEETTCGNSGNSVELPQISENLIGASLETQDETTLLSEDASAAEQMLALHDNSLARNGAEMKGHGAAAKDLCKIATYSSRRRNERTQSQNFAPQNHILPVQHPESSSRLELDRLKSSTLRCVDGDQSVDDVDGDAIRKRKKIRRSGRSDADDMVSPALNSRLSDEEISSEIATVESDNNFRNEGNGVDSGSRVERSDAGSLGCEGDHELNKGLDFQIHTMVKRKKRNSTRKRGTSDLVDPPAKVEAEGALGDRACDNCQLSQDSQESLDKRSCKENGDEHLPLVKRARVRMSRAFNADEEVTASLQVEDGSSKDTLISAIVQRSPSVNHENNIVSGNDPSVAESKSSEMSAKLSGDMADLCPSHVDKPSDSMSPSRVCIQTLGDKQNDMEFFAHEFSKTHGDEATQAQSNQLSGLPDGKACVPEVVPACYGDLQTRNCLNSESDPSGIKCPHQSDTKETPLDPDSMDLSASKSLRLCSSLDMTVLRVPDQSSHPLQSQENESSDHLLDNVGESLNEKCEKNGHYMDQATQSQAAELSTSFCSVVNNQEVDNMQETGNTLLKAEEESLGKDVENDNQAHMIQNPALSVTKSDTIVEEAELQCEAVYSSNCEDVVDNREQEMSCEGGEQKELIQTTNIVSVSENLSSEKMSLSPANIADSPVRGTPHSNSVCRISTAESANVMQNSSTCSLNVQFGENKFTCDDSVKQEGKVEPGVTQMKKVVSSDVQFTIESFETALGLLVRTKESIGRATRLAMDLVKFGASAKAMEILAQSLESESNLQRRVDLFFLVDSIAQCSKGLNGDTGGIYLSSIQVMLPRLLAAAVPAGATTQDNRRQCLKVLRLWLERRILPESIIRHHIRELDSLSLAPACLYSRRSARTERALDDPVRDMEGMLVDEYGSNATLQLPGFSMPAMRKDEDDESDSDEEDFESVTPEHESRIFEEHITPSITERHTRILEDVDGELEMEDVAPPWEAASSLITDQAENTESANYQLGQQPHPVPGTSLQHVASSSPQQPPLLPPAPPSNAQMSDSYSNGFDCSGYPGMLGNPQAGPPRMNPPPVPVNTMRCQSPESSYHVSRSESMPDGEGSHLQHRPYPSQPPPPHHYSYMEPDHHIKSRRDGPSYPHRSHYPPDFDERNYHDSHDRSRSAPNRNSWRYPPHSSYGPRYHDRHKGPYSSSSYSGHQRESGRFQNQRWSRSPRAYNNNRHSYQYKPHSEGPVPVGMREPGTWHQR